MKKKASYLLTGIFLNSLEENSTFSMKMTKKFSTCNENYETYSDCNYNCKLG